MSVHMFSTVHLLAQHEDDIKHKRKKNAMANHLDTLHQDKAGDSGDSYTRVLPRSRRGWSGRFPRVSPS